MLDADKAGWLGSFPLPLRHGLTIGELAKMLNGEKRLNADLRVIEMTGWSRNQWFDETGLPWVNPSPNIRNLTEAVLYPGLAMLESSTNYSVGRGTDSPFGQIGADWIRGEELARSLAAKKIPGVRFYPVQFTPASSNLSGKMVEGLSFVVTNRDVFSSSRLGLELAKTLGELYPKEIAWEKNRALIGNGGVLRALETGGDPVAAANAGYAEFLITRRKYLIYQ
jgi:uncharacterized protein YbbC (DUF1343 family)